MTHDIVRIVPSEAIAGYLTVFLSSDYGQELIKRFSYGATVTHIEGHHVAQIQVPILKNRMNQNKINEIMLEANRKRYEAYLLEQKAIKTVNDQVIYLTKKNSPYKHSSDLPMAAEELAQYNSSSRDSQDLN